MKVFRNFVIVNIGLLLIGWYFWVVRFNLDISPMIYASAIFAINTALAWWVMSRQQTSAYFLLGTSSFILVLNLILLRGLISIR